LKHTALMIYRLGQHIHLWFIVAKKIEQW